MPRDSNNDHDITTFGASVVPMQNNQETLSLSVAKDSTSPSSTPNIMQSNHGTTFHEPLEKVYPVTSPFYEHPAPSIERLHTNHDGKSISNVYEKDMESGMATPVSINPDENPFSSKISVDHNKECRMWPSRQTLQQTRMANKKKRNDHHTCAPVRDRWMQLSRRQRLIAKIALVLLVVGLIVGISVGVSKAVNGGVYASDGSSRPVARVVQPRLVEDWSAFAFGKALHDYADVWVEACGRCLRLAGYVLHLWGFWGYIVG